MARTEYPRPDFDRSHTWLSLDGVWDFAPDPDDVGAQANWQQAGNQTWTDKILVPFAWETPTSMVAKEWMPVGWYRTQIAAPEAWDGLRTILHFGAAHYACRVWIDGQAVGEHVGGYFPFAFDVTDALTGGKGELVVRVEAPVDKRYIPHGKQRSLPIDDYDGCAFTASSGIWQPVWLEGRPATYIDHVALAPTEALDGIQVTVTLAGEQRAQARLTLQVDDLAPQTIEVGEKTTVTATLPIANPELWSPRHPKLYTVRLRLTSPDGEDVVATYTGLRKVEVRGNRLYLNDEPLYMRGALDQGYWHETGYTAPDDDALRRDIELALAAGFNLLRKHIKIENPRWLYWADKLGLLVWAEPPCTGRYSHEAVALFEEQLPLMVARDGSHPSIIIWGIYNEEWGMDWRVGEDPERQEAVARAYDLLKACDPSRPIVDNSGWWHVKTDIVDWHYYDEDMETWRQTTAALAADPEAWFGHWLSETRWYETRLSVTGHQNQGKPLFNGEYGAGHKDNQGWLFRWQTQDLRRYDAFGGYIYTEFYDVEYEVVGLYSAERVLKDLDCDPADYNAETVIVIDVTPLEPGIDVIAANGDLSLRVRVSHHGREPLDGQIVWACDDDSVPMGAVAASAQPFVVSDPVSVHAKLPAGMHRLHLWFVDDAQNRLAHSYVDVQAAE